MQYKYYQTSRVNDFLCSISLIYSCFSDTTCMLLRMLTNTGAKRRQLGRHQNQQNWNKVTNTWIRKIAFLYLKNSSTRKPLARITFLDPCSSSKILSQESLSGTEDDLGVNMTESKESIRSLDFHFRIVVKESEIRFWIQESGMGFPKETHLILLRPVNSPI